MADASTSLGDPISSTAVLAEQIWSQKAHVEVKWGTWFAEKGMIAEDKGGESRFTKVASSPIVEKSEFGKQAGQRLNMRLRRALTRTPRTTTYGQYTYGNSYSVGNEQTISYLDMTIWLDKMKGHVGMDAPDISQQRTSADFEEDVRSELKDFLTMNREEMFLDGMIDGSWYGAIQDGYESAVTHPNVYYISGATTVAEVDETKVMTAGELRRIANFCNRVNSAGLNPVNVEGEKAHLVLASTTVIHQLLNDEEFRTVVANAHDRGSKNPLISGAIYKFYNLYIYAYERARVVSGSGERAATTEEVMILGANALAVGDGSEPRYLVRNEDAYGDRWGRGIAQITGVARADWYDNGTTLTLNQSSGIWRCHRPSQSWE